jgi:hypothetical protein
MLQFDTLPTTYTTNTSDIPIAQPDNYPTGRHSRYLGTLAPGQNRIQFTFLDRPDEDVLDESVNAIALFFDPGSYSDDTFTFRNLDSYVSCDSTDDSCAPGPTKSCPALYVEIAGEEEDRKLQDEEKCSDCRNPSCMGVGDCVLGPSHDNLTEDPNYEEMTSSGPTAPEEAETAATDADTDPDTRDYNFPQDVLGSGSIKTGAVMTNLAFIITLFLV